MTDHERDIILLTELSKDETLTDDERKACKTGAVSAKLALAMATMPEGLSPEEYLMMLMDKCDELEAEMEDELDSTGQSHPLQPPKLD